MSTGIHPAAVDDAGLTIDGQSIGSTINLPGNRGTIEVQASAESMFPIHTLERLSRMHQLGIPH